MPRKKILFLVTKATWGGAQKYVFDLATHLPKSDFGVVVAYGEHGKLAQILEDSRIETQHIPALGRDVALVSDVMSFFQIFNCIRRTKPDTIHLNSSKAAALGALAARLAGVPKIIFTVHGWPFKENRNAISNAIIYFISWFTAFLSSATIVVSKSDEAQGKRMWLVKSKIHYVPIGIEPPQFLSREEATAALSVTTTLPRTVTVAELTANKGIRYAIEAIGILKNRGVDVSYFVIGDGEERARLEALAKKLDVADCIQFLGFVPDASRYLKAFDVFLLPSIKEGMPYVLLEAAAAPLPIVATTAVETAYSIRVPTHDANAIADALVEVRNMAVEASIPYTLIDMLKRTVSLY